MTGPEHYREAERIIKEADGSQGMEVLMASRALAQVHATLALAAATALRGINAPLPEKDWDAWYSAASEARKNER